MLTPADIGYWREPSLMPRPPCSQGSLLSLYGDRCVERGVNGLEGPRERSAPNPASGVGAKSIPCEISRDETQSATLQIQTLLYTLC